MMTQSARQLNKRKYNATYKLRIKGVKINSRDKIIYYTDNDINQIISKPQCTCLMQEYNYKLKKDPQLKLNLSC